MSSLPWVSSVHSFKLFSKKNQSWNGKSFSITHRFENWLHRRSASPEVFGGSRRWAWMSICYPLKIFFFQSQEWCLFWASWPVFFSIFSESFFNSSLESMFLLFCLAFFLFLTSFWCFFWDFQLICCKVISFLYVFKRIQRNQRFEDIPLDSV